MNRVSNSLYMWVHSFSTHGLDLFEGWIENGFRKRNWHIYYEKAGDQHIGCTVAGFLYYQLNLQYHRHFFDFETINEKQLDQVIAHEVT